MLVSLVSKVSTTKRNLVNKTVLEIIALGGVITLASAAPMVLQALGVAALVYKKPRPQQRYYTKTVIKRLIDKKLLEFKKTKSGKSYLSITDRGTKELNKYRIGDLKISKPRRWDEKWRVVAFDIKEYRRGDRDNLRQELINFGFRKLQNSVWIYPYDCEELIGLLKSSYELGRHLLYMTVDHLEYDQKLRQDFNL